jgi:hypothetical protein
MLRSAHGRAEGASRSTLGPLCSAVRQRRQCCEIPADQCLLLLPTPAFHLTLRGNSGLDAIEFLMEDEFDGSPTRSVTIEGASLVLRDSFVEITAPRADIIGPVGAS